MATVPRQRLRTWTDAELLDGLWRYALTDPLCETRGYNRWARYHGRAHHHTIIARFGSWHDAKIRAEVEEELVVTVKGRQYLAAFDRWLRTTDDGRDWACHEFLQRLGHS